MNIRTGLLLSIVANLALAGGLGYVATYRTESSGPVAAASTKSDRPAPKSVVRKEKPDAIAEAPAPVAAFQWSQVEADDYKRYIANLRGIHCPEETIKDIIIADVTKLYAPRFLALRAPEKEYKFWENNSNWGASPVDRERQKQIRELTKEKAALLKDLLGIDVNEETRKVSGYTDFYERTMGFLSKEKRELVVEIQTKFSEMDQEIYRKAEGRTDAIDQAELKKIDEARRAELAKILTGPEMEEYQVRNSQTATQLRYDLASFSPSEEEFRKIFKQRSEFENEYGRMNGYDPDESPESRKKKADAQKKLDEALRGELGDRYADYQKSRDYSYQELARIAKRFDLPKENADKVYELKKVAEDQARKTAADPSLDAQQRQAALKLIQSETEKAVAGYVGERGLKTYKSGGGYWLRNLSSASGTRTFISP